MDGYKVEIWNLRTDQQICNYTKSNLTHTRKIVYLAHIYKMPKTYISYG